VGVGVGVGVGCRGVVCGAVCVGCSPTPGAGFGIVGAVSVAPGVVVPGVVAPGVVRDGSTGAGVAGAVGVVAGAWATGVPLGPFGAGSVIAA
jgi:hypothetical protein